MRLYRQLQEHERIVIQKMMYSSKKVSKSQIARVLGSSVSTVSREIRRNSTKGYNWQEAHAQSKKQCRKIKSKGKDAYIVTVVDRHLRLLTMFTVPIKDSQVVVRSIIEAIEEYPKGFVKTIPFDNGKEFSHYRILEEVLGCEIYFANSYEKCQIRFKQEHQS